MMKYVILVFLLFGLFILPKTVNADASVSTSLDTIVPIQNPWSIRPGVDSAMLIPAAQARQLTQVVMERNACVDELVMYKDLVQKHAGLHTLDSVSIANLKRQVSVTDTLRQAQVAAANTNAGAGKWTYGLVGFGAGTILATVSAVLIVILAR